MSQADQERWNARYQAGAYRDRSHPSVFLRERLPAFGLAAGARVLDIACGAGRNALYLAAQGYAVTALDGSAVAIDRTRAQAAERALTLSAAVADLEHGLPTGLGTFDLIVMVRYVNDALLRTLPAHLNPGGILLVEQHLQTAHAVGGPGRDRFRVPRDALRQALPALTCVVAEQGLVPDPDGQAMALSRLIARRED